MNRWTGDSGYARLDRRTITIAAVLAYGVGLWTHGVHWRSGAREAHNVTFWPHFLRDSTLSIPLVLLAVIAATMAVGRRAGKLPASGAVATGVAAALALGVPVHAGIFGHAAHHGPIAPLPVAMVAEFFIDLPAAMLVCFAVHALAGIRLPKRPVLSGRLAGAVSMAALLIAGIVAIPTSPATAVAPPSVCPVAAVTRTYAVTMINVDIPLNRWGDHDPAGMMYALTSQIPAIRAEELSREVSLGLRDDPIQPLVIRANEGDCVEITVTNSATGGTYGMNVDGLPFDRPGDKVGNNFSGEVAAGASTVYRYFVPNDKALEGAHYISPGAGHRTAIDHGLFGVLSVEPQGSLWLSPKDAATPIESGWEAVIWPANAPSFRENVKILHEVGNEKDLVWNRNPTTGVDKALPTVDPITEAYRPGSRALNYRSEPFLNRLQLAPHEKAHSYASTMFGDPATIIPQGYLGDPTKFRVVHGGAEVFHIYHLHGGGDRWRTNPEADTTNSYGTTGLNKTPVEVSSSDRVDAVNTGPGESFNAEIEGGAGGVQQAAGDFLFHCHIAEHYPSGMWGIWRVFDTLQADLAPLPDRSAKPTAVTSAELIGKTMPNGTVITKDNLAAWITPQIPPQGVTIPNPNANETISQDASVWDWTVDNTDPTHPLYLGEPEPTTAQTPNFTEGVPGHFGSRPGDRFDGNRPEILFNPVTGRPAFPLLRPHLDRRPPFSPNLHSGAPGLGETGGLTANPASANPWLARPDGLCPANAPVKNFNVVAVGTSVDVTPTKSDQYGMLFTLAQNKTALLAGQLKKEPLAIRMNVGDCGNVTLTSEESDDPHATFGGFAKVEMHIHHVQFDPTGSDGTSVGYSYEHSIRPYTIEDTTLAAPATAGSTTITVNRIDAKYRPGVAFGVGLGTESIEEATIVSVDPIGNAIVLDRPLTNNHPAGEGAGIEFIRYRWYADALLDNIFWHDHVDGIHGWGHGGVGMLIVEPKNSTYHDPTTGAEVASGTVVDIHSHPDANGIVHPMAKGLVEGSFREMVIWTLDDNPVTDSTINLHAAPWSDRGLDPSLRFSSFTWGDPGTPLLRAYPGDPVVIRAIHVGPTIDSFRLDGHEFYVEKRNYDPVNSTINSRTTDTIHSGVSERYTLILKGGAGGVGKQPGDYLYHNGIARRFEQGAWGIMRVLPAGSSGLQPLPAFVAPAGIYVQPTVTGARPPATLDPGNPCPASATAKSIAISAVDVPSSAQGTNGSGGTSSNLEGFITAAYVLTPNAADAKTKGVIDPLVVHVNAGDCLTVNFTNERAFARASFSVGELAKSGASSGVNVGFNSEQTVAPGGTQTYKVYADNVSIEAAQFSDFGGDATGKIGLYGALVVHEPGAWFTDPTTGAATTTGAVVDVHVPGQPGYRDDTLMLMDTDPQIGSDFMPYPTDAKGLTLINYKNAGRRTDDFSGTVATPLLQAYVGDPMRIHVLSTPGSEQPHVFRAGGLSWLRDPYMPGSQEVAEQGLAPYQGIDAHIIGGAGGRGAQTGDFFYGDNRRPFTEAGMWGVIRVLAKPASCDASSPIRQLDGCPLLTVSPASLVFPTRTVGALAVTQPVTVTNAGGGSLVVSGATVGGSNQSSFSATPTCSPLAKGQSCTFDVFFAPLDAGALTADLTIDSNGGSSKVVVTGTGAAVPPPTTVPTTTAPTTTAPSTTVPTSTPPSPPTPAVTPPAALTAFTAVDPFRAFDTRPGEVGLLPVLKSKVGGGYVLDVQLTALAGRIPGSGVAAVSLNVTAADAEGAGFVTVFPCGVMPVASSVNFVADQIVANAVIAPVSSRGHVCFFASAPTNLIVDVNGWYADDAGFNRLPPTRVFDTRSGQHGVLEVQKAKVGDGNVLDVTLTNLSGLIPASGVSAVSLNVTVDGGEHAGYVTVYPCGTMPVVSSVNFTSGQTVANAVIAAVSSTGHLCFYSSAATDVVVDVNGWFADGVGFNRVAPVRVFDTRPGQHGVLGVAKTKVGAGHILEVELDNLYGTSANRMSAVALNVTVDGAEGAGFVTVYPCGTMPVVSSLNFVAGQVVANAVTAPLSSSGHVCFFSSKPTDLIVDLTGWFSATP